MWPVRATAANGGTALRGGCSSRGCGAGRGRPARTRPRRALCGTAPNGSGQGPGPRAAAGGPLRRRARARRGLGAARSGGRRAIRRPTRAGGRGSRVVPPLGRRRGRGRAAEPGGRARGQWKLAAAHGRAASSCPLRLARLDANSSCPSAMSLRISTREVGRAVASTVLSVIACGAADAGVDRVEQPGAQEIERLLRRLLGVEGRGVTVGHRQRT